MVLNADLNQKQYLSRNPLDPYSLTSDAIFSIFQDSADNIWVGTFKTGINISSERRSKFQKHVSLSGSTGLSHNSVTDFKESANGNIYIGTDGGGVNVFNPRTDHFDYYLHDPNNPNSINSNVVLEILEDGDYLWVGHWSGGLSRIDRKSGKIMRFENDPNDSTTIAENNILSLNIDKQGLLWIGTFSAGITLFNRETLQAEKHIIQSPGDKFTVTDGMINDIYRDHSGDIWVATITGINHYNDNDKTFRQYVYKTHDDKIEKHSTINGFFETEKGDLYAVTFGGLVKYEESEDEFILIDTINQYLPSLTLVAGLEGTDGNIWLSSTNGMVKWDASSGAITDYDISDGLQGIEFNTAALKSNKYNLLFFGGVNGFNFFKPEEIQDSNLDPPTYITNFYLFGNRTYSNDSIIGANRLKDSFINLKEMILKHDQNIFTIEFTVLDYTSPSRNQYKYIMEGFDDDWETSYEGKTEVSYMNLPSGEYTFRVVGSNSDGIFTSNEAVMMITVLPPWWATWWFRTIAALLLITVLFKTYKWRENQFKNNQKLLQEKVNQATSAVKEQNDELLAQKSNLQLVIDDTNFVINEAINSGNFQARINVTGRDGEWGALGKSINTLFDTIVTPFNVINHIVNKMASGDLTKRYKEDAKGDVLELRDNLNSALNNVSELLLEITDQVGTIGVASIEMKNASEEINLNMSEIAAGVAEMSRGARDQLIKIDQSSDLLGGIMQFSTHMGGRANTINDKAKDGVEKSKEGITQVDHIWKSIQKILDYSEKTTETVNSLEGRSREINRVLSIIQDIAAQTNLLALNAAIEAAQAGDAGRGFAVVAEEIRKLAEDSKASVKVIEQLVGGVQNDTHSTAELIKIMGESIKNGESAAQVGIKTLEEIVKSYNDTYEMSEEIVDATTKQTDQIVEVVNMMESLAVIAEETAAGTEQIATSSSELSTGMTTYSEKVKRVSEVVDALKNRVNQFEL